MALYLLFRVLLGQLSPVGNVFRLRLGRLLAIRTAGCSLQSAQLQPNRPILVLEGCFRLGEATRVPIPRQFPLRYHHEGDSQPLLVDLKGGHQTLTNSMGVITRVDSSPKNSYPPRSLQTPRVTRSMGNAQNLLKLRFALVERWGRTGSR